MVSSNDSIIVSVKNSIVTKINTLIGNHDSSNLAHSDIRSSINIIQNSLNNKASSSHTHTTSDITNFLNAVYPVGAIYISVNSKSPATLFGGTWVKLTDTFLYATSGTADTGKTATAGEASHTLTVDEMPSHKHSTNKNTDSLMSMGGTGDTSSGFGGGNLWAQTPKAYATLNNTGGGQAHNNMPPYMKVYMWKRTA